MSAIAIIKMLAGDVGFVCRMRIGSSFALLARRRRERQRWSLPHCDCPR
jgi:hypothetical protein